MVDEDVVRAAESADGGDCAPASGISTASTASVVEV